MKNKIKIFCVILAMTLIATCVMGCDFYGSSNSSTSNSSSINKTYESSGDMSSTSKSTKSSSSSTKKVKCKSCKKSFSDAKNKKYIRKTNMCKTCYQNYCYASGTTPKSY